MLYLLETNLSEQKSVFFALTKVYGIGKSTAFLICKKLGFAFNFKIKNLSTSQIYQISKLMDSLSFIIANDLKRSSLLSKQRLILIKSYRGLRKKQGFPVRGQRTHTNAKTAKRNR